MQVIAVWTGGRADALRRAFRMTNEGFAEHLGVAVRTVANWRKQPGVQPAARNQEVLDTALERAPDEVKEKFALLAGEASRAPGYRSSEAGPSAAASDSATDLEPDEDGRPAAQAPSRAILAGTPQVPAPAPRPSPDTHRAAVSLTVAIAIVVTRQDVLLVCRRDTEPSGITWQFPAGIVKPGASSAMVAVRETLAETGVHCSVRQSLGSRIHPLSGLNCEYFLCDYLTGEARNCDPSENVSVVWAPRADVARFISVDNIFPPVMRVLEETT
jgi:8-oxo-dGTP diphosphatase